MRDFSLDLVPESSQYFFYKNKKTQSYFVMFTGKLISLFSYHNLIKGKTVPVCKECLISTLFELSPYLGFRILCRSGFCSKEVLYTAGLNTFALHELWSSDYSSKINILDLKKAVETAGAGISKLIMNGAHKNCSTSKLISKLRPSTSAQLGASNVTVEINPSQNVLDKSKKESKGYFQRRKTPDRLEGYSFSVRKVSLCPNKLMENHSLIKRNYSAFNFSKEEDEDDPEKKEIDYLINKYLGQQDKKDIIEESFNVGAAYNALLNGSPEGSRKVMRSSPYKMEKSFTLSNIQMEGESSRPTILSNDAESTKGLFGNDSVDFEDY